MWHDVGIEKEADPPHQLLSSKETLEMQKTKIPAAYLQDLSAKCKISPTVGPGCSLQDIYPGPGEAFHIVGFMNLYDKSAFSFVVGTS